MNNTIFALLLVSFAAPALAADFSALSTMKAADIGNNAGVVAAPVSAAPVNITAQAPQDLVYKFNQVKNDIWKLESDTTWLRSDIDRLESTARQIAQYNTYNPFFQNDLRRMAGDMNRYNMDAQRLGMDVKNLLSLAQQDQELNSIAREIERDARTLLNRAQFDIENSTQRLEWTVRGARPELIGYDAQWQAIDISRNARNFTWKVRELSYDAQSLVSNTRP